MAYGRLDIYWPDGRIESYLLEAPTVTVGRAADNTIVLDTETVSRHHFSITHTNNSTYLNDLDSENGVMIDGVPLKSYEAHMLDSVEELQVGYLRLIYHPMDETVTAPMKAARDEDTQRTTRTNAEFSVTLDTARLSVWPASSSSAEIAIHNRTLEPRRFSITIAGMPSEWLRVNRPEVEIAPTDTTYVLLNIKPPRRPDIKPMEHQVTIEVTPKDKPEQALKTTLPVSVRAYSGLGMALNTTSLSAGDALIVYLHNQGSEDLTLALSGRSADGRVTLRFSMPRVTLAAGTRSQVRVEVVPSSRPWVGKTETYKFVVIAQAQNASRFIASIEARTTVSPRLPLWGAITAVFGTLGIVLAVIAGMVALASASAPPTLQALRAPSVRVEAGSSISLAWDASNVERFLLSVNGLLVTELPGTARSYTLDTSSYSGELLISLQGEKGQQVVTETLGAQVIPQLAIKAFNIAPSVLVRNVVTALTVEWETEGATEAALAGLNSFTNAPIPETLEPTGRLEGISGYPTNPFTVELLARSADGDTMTQIVQLEVIDATCTATVDVPLYQGPDARLPQVSVVPATSVVVVVAQSAPSGWLRIGLPGSSAPAWGARDSFICNANFNLNDLRTEVTEPLIPTAPPTPTATASPPPSATPALRQTPGTPRP